MKNKEVKEHVNSAGGRKKKGWIAVSVVLVICLLAGGLFVQFYCGGVRTCIARFREEPVQYTYVLVHGLGGWGEESKINDIAPYWGANTGNLKAYLTSEGYAVTEASVGPFSSTWDRACELYAQLTGTRVDYGEAHAKQHGHERYGRTYDTALCPEWLTQTPGGQKHKINLMGHSFGGNTVRLFAHLMAYGAPEEVKAGNEVSDFFKGGKGDYIHSVTTLCSPHNGSTLYYVLDSADLPSLVLKFTSMIAKVSGNTQINQYYDFHLEQFGITSVPGKTGDLSGFLKTIPASFTEGKDNAAYELSPDGAKALNDLIEPVDDIYYFSYAYCTTSESSVTGNQVPGLNTLPILIPTATLMGKYAENTESDFVIDKTWLPNDGLVNVVSAQYPSDAQHKELDAEDIPSGIWNVAPVRTGDHGTVIGLNADTEATHQFYLDLFNVIDTCKRK